MPRIRPAAVPVWASVGDSERAPLPEAEPPSSPRPGLGQAEVEDLHLAVGCELDVGGLEVAVDDALLVRLLEGLGDLLRDLEGLGDRDRPALQALGEVLAGGELHREEVGGRAVGERRALEAVDVGDACVVEGREDLRLALEAGEPIGIGGKSLGKQLDRDVASELRVRRPVDVAHAARAEGRHDPVGSETGLGRKGQSAADTNSRPRGGALHRSIPSRAATSFVSGRADRGAVASTAGSSVGC